MLSEENLKELRHNLAHLSLPAVREFYEVAMVGGANSAGQAAMNFAKFADSRARRGWVLDRDPFLLETNVPGIFAVGDVRHGSIKRVASGVGEGSVAVQFIHQYLNKV